MRKWQRFCQVKNTVIYYDIKINMFEEHLYCLIAVLRTIGLRPKLCFSPLAPNNLTVAVFMLAPKRIE